MFADAKPKAMNIEVATNALLAEIKNKYDYLKFYRRDKLSPRVPVFIKDGLVEVMDKEDIKALIIQISNRIQSVYEARMGTFGCPFNDVNILLLTESNANSVFKTIALRNELRLRETVKPFAFKSDPSLTFCRIPFDPIPGSLMPGNWKSLLDNFSNQDAVCMWIGSLFMERSDRSQYLWLYGKGGNGKSTLSRVISSLMGDFVRFEQAPKNEDKHWTCGLLYKRLIVLDDCNQYGFVKTGLFKSLTGSSKVRIEPKFCNPYDTDLDCKFLFTSNEVPMISDDLADQRRLIFSSAKNEKKFNYDPDFEKNLKADLPEFISYCMDLYESNCADGRPVPVDETETLELAEIFNEEVSAWFDSIAEFKDGSITPVSDLNNAIRMSNINRRHIKKYLESKGVKNIRAKIGGASCRALTGFRMKVISGRF